MDDYHIIAPDLTGHEAAEITDWLIQNQMKELALVFGVSLGSVIAMNVISHEELLHTHCAVMEGASLTRVHGVEWLFRAMFREMKKRPETIANLYASMPKQDADVQQKLLDTMANTDKEELFNLVHACNSYVFEFGNRDSHLVCQKAIRKYYHEARITTRKGYGHCGYMFTHREDYAALLRSYMEKEK